MARPIPRRLRRERPMSRRRALYLWEKELLSSATAAPVAS